MLRLAKPGEEMMMLSGFSRRFIEFVVPIPFGQASLPSFVLDSEGALISVNAIEAAASAIEQSIIGAKNAALLVAKYLGNR